MHWPPTAVADVSAEQQYHDHISFFKVDWHVSWMRTRSSSSQQGLQRWWKNINNPQPNTGRKNAINSYLCPPWDVQFKD